MRKSLIVLVALSSLVILSGCTRNEMPEESTNTMESISGDTANNNGAETVTVNVQNFQYTPKTITIKAGDTVTWVNNDVVRHTATSNDGVFDGDLPSKGSYSYTFTEAGTYPYYCAPHPTMKGTVIVE